jgi:hypothetical protein
MTSRGLVQLCFYSELIPMETDKINFTRADCTHLFDRIVAVYYNPNSRTYGEGVQLGKRVSYFIFRNSLIPEIAAAKHMTVEETVKWIGDSITKHQTKGNPA